MGSVAPVFPYPGGVAGDEPADPVAGAPGHFAWTKWIKQFVKNLDQAQRDNTPPGIIVPYGGTTAPTGWHLCDGTAHGSADLKTVLGGSDNTPDLRDKFILGASATKPKGTTGGAETHILTVSEMPSHSHGGTGRTSNDSPDHAHFLPGYSPNLNGQVGNAYVFGATGDTVFGQATSAGAGLPHQHDFTVQGEGGGAAHENMPPFYALTYIIKK